MNQLLHNNDSQMVTAPVLCLICGRSDPYVKRSVHYCRDCDFSWEVGYDGILSYFDGYVGSTWKDAPQGTLFIAGDTEL